MRLQINTLKMPYKGKTVALPIYSIPPQAFADMHNFTYDSRKTPGLMPGWSLLAQINTPTTDTYNADDTWVCPAGVVSAIVECWGGGGSGAGATIDVGGGGGGGGAYAKSTITVTPGNSYAVVVGGAGEDTSFDTNAVLAKAGSDGLAYSPGTGGAGGSLTNSIGNTKYAGGDGHEQVVSGMYGTSRYGGGGGSSAGTTAAGVAAVYFTGGVAPTGGGNGGDGGDGVSHNDNGSAGTAPGGGGGGASGTTGAALTGGAGATGRVKITYAQPIPVTHIDQFIDSEGSSYFFAITQDGADGSLMVYDPTTNTFSSLGGSLTGDYNNVISADIWPEPGAELYCFTNGKDAIMKYDKSAVAALGGLTDAEPGSIVINTAECIRSFNGFLCLYATTEDGDFYPFRCRWNKKGYPEVWKNDADGLGQAGLTDLTESIDWFVTAERLNYYMVIYKQKSIYFQEYVGSPTVMSFRRFSDGVGIIGKRAVVSMGDSHIFVGSINIYALTSSSCLPIGDDIATEFFGLLNPNKHSQVTMFRAEDKDECILAFPSVNSDTPDLFYVYNITQKNWTGPHDRACTCFGNYASQADKAMDDLVGNWTIQTGFWDERSFSSNSPLNMMGDYSGNIYKLYDGTTAAGTIFNGRLTYGLYDFDTPTTLKRLQKMWVDIDGSTAGNIKLYVGYTDNTELPVVWSGPYTMPITGRTIEFDMDISAKFFQFRLETDNGIPFNLLGISAGIMPRSTNR